MKGLKSCPFCDGEVRVQLTDQEGNWHEDDYCLDPYSGIGYIIVHPESECILNNFESQIVFESKEDAIAVWNGRV